MESSAFLDATTFANFSESENSYLHDLLCIQHLKKITRMYSSGAKCLSNIHSMLYSKYKITVLQNEGNKIK